MSTPRTVSGRGHRRNVEVRHGFHFFGEFFPIRGAPAVDLHFFQLAHLHEREQMILRFRRTRKKAEETPWPRKQVGADCAGGSRAKTVTAILFGNSAQVISPTMMPLTRLPPNHTARSPEVDRG